MLLTQEKIRSLYFGGTFLLSDWFAITYPTVVDIINNTAADLLRFKRVSRQVKQKNMQPTPYKFAAPAGDHIFVVGTLGGKANYMDNNPAFYNSMLRGTIPLAVDFIATAFSQYKRSSFMDAALRETILDKIPLDRIIPTDGAEGGWSAGIYPYQLGQWSLFEVSPDTDETHKSFMIARADNIKHIFTGWDNPEYKFLYTEVGE